MSLMHSCFYLHCESHPSRRFDASNCVFEELNNSKIVTQFLIYNKIPSNYRVDAPLKIFKLIITY